MRRDDVSLFFQVFGYSSVKSRAFLYVCYAPETAKSPQSTSLLGMLRIHMNRLRKATLHIPMEKAA